MWWRWNSLYPATVALHDRGHDMMLGEAELDDGWLLTFSPPEGPDVSEDELAELVEVWGNPAGDGVSVWVRKEWGVDHYRDLVRNIVAPPGTVLLIADSVDGRLHVQESESTFRAVREAGLLSFLQGLVVDRRLVV